MVQFASKVTLGETTVSKDRPARKRGARFPYVARGCNRFLNVLASTNGTAWTSKQTSKETCIDGPGNYKSWQSPRVGLDWDGQCSPPNSMLFSVV